MAIVRLVNPHQQKRLTRAEVERRQARAVQFTRNVVGDPGLADEIENLTAEQYALHKGFQLENPQRGEHNMATQTNKHDVNAKLNKLSDAIEQIRASSTARRTNPKTDGLENVSAKLDEIASSIEELRRERERNPGDENSDGLHSPRAQRQVRKLRQERDEILDALQDAQDALDEDQPDHAQEILDEILDQFEVVDEN